jgi:chromosome segregation ATPase
MRIPMVNKRSIFPPFDVRTPMPTLKEIQSARVRIQDLEARLDERAQIAVNAINRAEKAEARAEKAEAEYARIVDEFHALIPDLTKANAHIKELEGTLKDLRGHLVDGLDDDAYLVLVIDRALAAAEKEEIENDLA